MTPQHLIVAPILIPLLAGAVMLFYEGRQRGAKQVISLMSTGLLLLVAVELMRLSKGPDGETVIGTYLVGNWPSPFAIVLVLDRLSALMLLLTAALALPALAFASVRWDSRGQHFHSLFQFLLMGINGAFLTGDLFNLFVFFEVLLAASYGLLLHGAGALRVRAGLQYIAINLTASLLFLLGVSLIYGVTGTLNMADLASRIADVAAPDRPLLHAGAALMGVAFLVKAAMWPVAFWLPITYMAAPPPVAAAFAILSKVGVYIVLRLSTLVFAAGQGAAAGASTGFGSEVLFVGGLATLGFGTLGVLASQGLGRVAGCFVLVSAGTILTVIGMLGLGGSTALLAGALYYLVSSTLALGALYLIIEIVERDRGEFASVMAVTAELYGFGGDESDEAQAQPGTRIPATLTLLGLAFAACALLLAGLPPLSGFLGKLAMLSAAFNPAGLGAGGAMPGIALVFTVFLLLSSLAGLVALIRVGIHTFWAAAEEDERPAVALSELASVIALIGLTILMTIQAHPVLRYMDATAAGLRDPAIYINGVTDAPRAGSEAEKAGAGPR